MHGKKLSEKLCPLVAPSIHIAHYSLSPDFIYSNTVHEGEKKNKKKKGWMRVDPTLEQRRVTSYLDSWNSTGRIRRLGP